MVSILLKCEFWMNLPFKECWGFVQPSNLQGGFVPRSLICFWNSSPELNTICCCKNEWLNGEMRPPNVLLLNPNPNRTLLGLSLYFNKVYINLFSFLKRFEPLQGSYSSLIKWPPFKTTLSLLGMSAMEEAT